MAFNLDNFLKQNPWRIQTTWSGPEAYPRPCLEELLSHLKDPGPRLVKGPRGSGKTTLLQLLVRHLMTEGHIPAADIYYFNLDDPLTRDFFAQPAGPLNFIRGFGGSDQPGYLILDESQILQAVLEHPLEYLVDLAGAFKGRLILSSSRADFVPPLPGLRSVEISPFSYKEYLNRMLNAENIYLPETRGITVEKLPSLCEGTYPKLLQPHLDDYLAFGGYPAVVREYTAWKRPEILRQVYEEIHQAIRSFGGTINQPEGFNKLIRHLAVGAGRLQNLSQLAQASGLSRPTTADYIRILTDNYLIRLVYPVRSSPAGRDVPPPEAEMTSHGVNPYRERGGSTGMPLVYFNDTGLRNLLLGQFSGLDTRPDRQNLLEHLLYSELRRMTQAVNFWRSASGRPIIFIYQIEEHLNLAMVLPDFPGSRQGHRGLVSASARLKPHQVIVLTRDYFSYQKGELSEFIYLPASMIWLLPEFRRI